MSDGVLAEAFERAGIYSQAQEDTLVASPEPTPVALPPRNVRVFCDASCFGSYRPTNEQEVVGSYAFYIPEFEIKEGGIERGLTNTSLELLAAVNGAHAAT